MLVWFYLILMKNYDSDYCCDNSFWVRDVSSWLMTCYTRQLSYLSWPQFIYVAANLGSFRRRQTSAYVSLLIDCPLWDVVVISGMYVVSEYMSLLGKLLSGEYHRTSLNIKSMLIQVKARCHHATSPEPILTQIYVAIWRQSRWVDCVRVNSHY